MRVRDGPRMARVAGRRGVAIGRAYWTLFRESPFEFATQLSVFLPGTRTHHRSANSPRGVLRTSVAVGCRSGMVPKMSQSATQIEPLLPRDTLPGDARGGGSIFLRAVGHPSPRCHP